MPKTAFNTNVNGFPNCYQINCTLKSRIKMQAKESEYVFKIFKISWKIKRQTINLHHLVYIDKTLDWNLIEKHFKKAQKCGINDS